MAHKARGGVRERGSSASCPVLAADAVETMKIVRTESAAGVRPLSYTGSAPRHDALSSSTEGGGGGDDAAVRAPFVVVVVVVVVVVFFFSATPVVGVLLPCGAAAFECWRAARNARATASSSATCWTASPRCATPGWLTVAITNGRGDPARIPNWRLLRALCVRGGRRRLSGAQAVAGHLQAAIARAAALVESKTEEREEGRGGVYHRGAAAGGTSATTPGERCRGGGGVRLARCSSTGTTPGFETSSTAATAAAGAGGHGGHGGTAGTASSATPSARAPEGARSACDGGGGGEAGHHRGDPRGLSDVVEAGPRGGRAGPGAGPDPEEVWGTTAAAAPRGSPRCPGEGRSWRTRWRRWWF